MFKRARDNIGTAADHGLQGARAAGKVDDLDLEPLVLEESPLLGDRQRQVVQQVLAAHRDRHLLLFERLRLGQQRQDEDGGAGDDESAAGDNGLHRQLHLENQLIL